MEEAKKTLMEEATKPKYSVNIPLPKLHIAFCNCLKEFENDNLKGCMGSIRKFLEIRVAHAKVVYDENNNLYSILCVALMMGAQECAKYIASHLRPEGVIDILMECLGRDEKCQRMMATVLTHKVTRGIYYDLVYSGQVRIVEMLLDLGLVSPYAPMLSR